MKLSCLRVERDESWLYRMTDLPLAWWVYLREWTGTCFLLSSAPMASAVAKREVVHNTIHASLGCTDWASARGWYVKFCDLA